MLGLRINPLSRRNRRSLTPTSDTVRDSDAMATLQPVDSLLSLSTPTKNEGAVHVKEIDASDSSENDTTTATQQTTTTTRTSSYQVTQVFGFTQTLKSRIVEEIDEVDDGYFDGVSIESYAQYIANERLVHMPIRGSQWDRILRSAEFFGYQMDKFGDAIQEFVPKSAFVTQTALGSLQLLLEVGHLNAPALEPTFRVLNEFGHLIAQTVRQKGFMVTEVIKKEVAELYSSFVSLIGDIAICYRRQISSLSAKGSAVIDFDAAFGETISHIWSKKEVIVRRVWDYQLSNRTCPMSIDSLRRKLEPADHNVKGTISGRIADAAERTQGTCEWVQSHLLDFLRSNNRTFTITGLPGTGKSMIAGWIAERLQRPIGRVTYETVAYTFPHDTPSQRKPLAFLKSILSQLLERNVGDVQVYDSLVAAFKKSPTEEGLWGAVKTALRSLDKEGTNLIIIVDGLDEVSGKAPGKDAAALHKRLHECVGQFPRARAITLSRGISHLHSAGTTKLVINLEANRADISKYLHEALSKCQHYDPRSDNFVDDLVTLGKGSFIHAFLTVKLLGFENSYDNFWKAGSSIPADLSSLMEKIAKKIDMKKNETTKHLVHFMLAVARPLSVNEMEELLSIDLAKRTIRARTDVRKHVKEHCQGLVVERQGLLRFKHSTIKEYFAHQVSTKEAQTDITKRLLFYAKYTLTSTYEPSFDLLGENVVRDAFHSHSLLEYAVRHWLVHFRGSTFCSTKDEIHLSAEFKEMFPGSTFFSMLEWNCWQADAIDYDLTLRIRTACFGEQHRSVIQTLVILGCLHRSSDVARAGEFFYRASIIGRTVLYQYSAVVVACTSAFLTLTSTITITKRTTLVTYREEMIRFMIEICVTKHGKSSDQVIKWYKVLAKLYIEIKEEYRATIIYQELYEILLIRFGKNDPEVRDVCQALGQLDVTFKGDEELLKYNEFLFETAEEDEENISISVFWRLVAVYEGQRKWVLAERLYLKFWQRISMLCRLKGTTEFHMLKIQVALAYVHFLKRIERIEEASSILIALWAEYEHSEFTEETIIIRIREIGIVCRSLSLFSVAISIFTKVWGWFKSCGKADHDEAAATIIQFTEVIEEYEETTVTKKTTTTTVTTVTETMTREIFETTFTRCKKHGKADAAFFKVCKALIALYIKQEKWSECEIVIKRSLELTWKAVLTFDAKLTLSGTFVKECIFVATQLAICYHRQRFFEKAEELYLRIYRACVLSFSIDHVHVTEASMALIRFYEEYHRHDKVIEIYVELLEGYRNHCGHSHTLTIKTLYAIARIYMMLGRKESYEYYIEIVRVLNINQKGCHRDAIDAAIIVCGYYYEQSKWTKLREICSVLWETFIHNHHKFTETQIITLYERYTYVLQVHAKVEFSVLYQLSIQYKETVIKQFGVLSAVYITMLLGIAKLYEQSEEHWHESVTIYEEIITKTRTTTTTTIVVEETIIKTVKKRLSKMYVTIITKGKSSTTTIERGIIIALELYESLKIEFGCWHEKTLVQLRELCILYKTHGSKESHACILRLLQQSVIEIISSVTTSYLLYTAAVSLAKIYVTCGITSTGRDLLFQLRHLILLHDIGSTKEITISLGKVGKVALAFLIAFEQGLTQVVYSYSEMMVDIMLEIHLKDEYLKVIRTETHIETILEVGSKLRGFWFTRGRKIECELLDRKLFALFVSKYESLVNGGSDTTFSFYVAILEGLNVDRKKVDFATVCCSAANSKVKALLEEGHFKAAHELAKVAFAFIKGHEWYYTVHRISYGYKLAEFLAGIDVARPKDKALRKEMLETSRNIVAETMAAARAIKIEFVSLRYKDLEGLVRLLGEQENYAELEVLLESLYKSREVQRNWSPEIVLSIGRLLVHAHYGAGHAQKAIDLCDTLCYNLRRSRGWLDASSLAMSRLLAELYTAQHEHRKAMAVHEEMLRELDEDEDDAEQVANVKQESVAESIELLQRTFQRLGGWDKHERRYLDLYSMLKKRFSLPTQPIEQWQPKGADSRGCYTLPREWRLDSPQPAKEAKKHQYSGSLRRIVARRSGGYDAFKDLIMQSHGE